MTESLKVEGMTCSCCVSKVETGVQELQGISSINIDMDTEEVQVEFDHNEVSLDQIKQKIEEQGYQILSN
ncbi:MAG TPA: heavy-metal-associated domain-containing protein [Candidatus Avamphibacillus intestinigallinarum]|nr:heavy-metal-associated domain-containing protein [Candidatus Avamphibacillus intestinigallinarum]